MLPPVRQRLVVIVAVVIGALVWSLTANALRAADGMPGLTLVDARVGVLVAGLLFVVAGIPALLGGLITSATGTVLSGVFVVAAALGVLAAHGGGMEHWAGTRTMALSVRYTALAGEMVMWGVGVGLVTLVFGRFQSLVRRWLISGAVDETEPAGIFPAVGTRWKSVAAGAVSVAVAGGLAAMLIRSPDTGQIFWSLVVAFLIGGLAARMAVPGCHPWAIMVSPAVVGVIGYLWAALAFADNRDSFLTALFAMEQSLLDMPGIALALPIHYASAGVVGVTLGIGWARHFAATTQRQTPG